MLGLSLDFGKDACGFGSSPFSKKSVSLRQGACLGKSASTAQGKWGRDMRVSGTVKFFNASKGFGFIAPADGSKDVFVHATALEQAGIHTLKEGDKVSFILEDDRKGRGKQAGKIEID